ncbi:hypothetical protein CR513_53446, partial [Mucuna pruriens]
MSMRRVGVSFCLAKNGTDLRPSSREAGWYQTSSSRVEHLIVKRKDLDRTMKNEGHIVNRPPMFKRQN